MTSLEKKARVSGWIMKASYIGCLLALTLSTWVWVQEGRQPSITIWVLRELPLLIFATAVFKHQLRGIAWMCFVCLGYFLLAVVEAMSPLAIWFNHVELALIVLLFCSATIFIRWYARSQKPPVAAAADPE